MAELPKEPVDSRPAENPLLQIPVTAAQAASRQLRVRLAIGSAIVIALAAAALLYKRSVDPLHAKESYDSGVRLLAIARYDQAILAFDRAATLKPDMADAYLMRAHAYNSLSKTEEAIHDLTRVLELRPADTQALVERGLANLAQKDYPSALADANRAIAADPRLASAYNLRGLTVRTTGDLRKALADFTRAVEIAPNQNNYYQRGSTYQMLGEHRLAIADFDQVIAFEPGAAPAYFARAESRRAMGDLAGAKADHQQGRIIDGR